MGFGPIKIYDKAMKLIKELSETEVSKEFWDNIYRKKDLKLNRQLKSPARNDKLYKKKKKKKVNTSWNATHHNKKGTDNEGKAK